jgi:hypothetical protein
MVARVVSARMTRPMNRNSVVVRDFVEPAIDPDPKKKY